MREHATWWELEGEGVINTWTTRLLIVFGFFNEILNNLKQKKIILNPPQITANEILNVYQLGSPGVKGRLCD